MTGRTVVVGRRNYFRWLIAAALVVGVCPVAWADPKTPGPMERSITSSVVSLLRQHLSRRPLDKEISQRGLKTFLKQLDSMKLYFYQSDIDKFMEYKDKLSDQIINKDVSFAYMVFRTFLERVDERVKTIDELLAEPQDFTIDEEMKTDRDQITYPRDAAEARDRWRQRIKCDLLLLKMDKKEDDEAKSSAKKQQEDSKSSKDKAAATSDDPSKSSKKPATAKKAKGAEGQEAIDRLKRRYHSRAKQMHQIDSQELLEIYLNAFTTSFDPHTDYMSPDNFRNFKIAMSLELEGIGASLTNEDGYTVVKQIIPRGAADKDGRLKIEDKIVGVGQDDAGEMVDVIDMKLRDVVKMIRGEGGKTVRLEVIPEGGTERKIYKIVREKIKLQEEEARGEIFDVGRKANGAPYRVGVIELRSFYRDMEAERLGSADFKSATRDVRNILDGFNRKNVDAVILDLRYNGGGSLPEAVSLTTLFTGKGPVVQVKNFVGRVDTLEDDAETNIAWRGPLVVLVNKFSASASEILAGAIQDYHRGLIVGDHSTHGKGTVQSLMDIGQLLFRQPDYMGALKITMQWFYRPNGDSTQKRGVLSDIELPSVTTHLDVGEADLDYPLDFDKVDPVQYAKLKCVTPAIRDRLYQLSRQRVQGSEKFQEVDRDIARYKARKAKKYVALNEEKFFKERMELDSDKEAEKAIERLNESKDGIKRDYYLDEALAIVADYLNLDQTATAPAEAVGAR